MEVNLQNRRSGRVDWLNNPRLYLKQRISHLYTRFFQSTDLDNAKKFYLLDLHLTSCSQLQREQSFHILQIYNQEKILLAEFKILKVLEFSCRCISNSMVTHLNRLSFEDS
jgi:hypothetical protein